MSAQAGELSPSQGKALAQFRANIQDVLSALPSSEDAFLLRWLRARSFDLQKSEDMLRKHVAFRKQQDLDHILEWQPPEVVQLYTAFSACGHDREGGPVWYNVVTHLDLKGLMLSVPREDLLRDRLRHLELLLRLCEQQSQKLGKKVEKITAIFDLEGLGLRHLWKPGVEFAQEFLSVLEANYPEILRHLIIVRAPSLFAVVFNLLKSYISAETHKKIVVLRENWKQELSKFISADQRPVEYGGTMTDPDGDPKCPSKINYGGEVPRRYYLRLQVRTQFERTASVGRGSSQQVEQEILLPGCVLRWQFASEGGDIGFGVFLKTKVGERQRAGEMSEVLPSQRYNAHLVPEDRSLTCPQAGVYVLRFDNTYSLVHSKHISYTVEVLLPDPTFTEKVEKF